MGSVQDGAACWITTEKELINQIRYNRQIAPEMPGISLNAFNIYPFLMEKADKVFYQYYIMPVITLIREKDEIILTNIGGMDGHNIAVKYSDGDGKEIGVKQIKLLPVNEKIPLSAEEEIFWVTIEPGKDYTVLEGMVKKR